MIIRVIQVLLSFSVLIIIALLMIKRKSNASISLLWMAIALAVFLFGVWPGSLNLLCNVLGINYPPILAVCIIVTALLGIVFYLSIEISVLQNKVRELSIHISLLNGEMHAVKNQLDENEPEV